MTDDLISRQAVFDIINFDYKWLLDVKAHIANTDIAFSRIKSRIAGLPSVNPQVPCDKSAMMYEIYMEGVNMTGEYQGCWVRFKDIKKIVDKYMGDKE